MDALYQAFRDPPASCSISPYWFWNGKVTAAESRRQIREMVRQGVRAVVVFNWAGLEPDYLSDAYWDQVGAALDAAREAGLTLNFADEWLWPSGQAWVYTSPDREPSRVLQLHPEYRMRRLTCRQADPGAPSPWKPTPRSWWPRALIPTESTTGTSSLTPTRSCRPPAGWTGRRPEPAGNFSSTPWSPPPNGACAST